MTGMQIAGVLQRMNVTQPLILLTGSGSAVANGTMTEGISLVLHKPVTEAELREGILKVVGGRTEAPEEIPLCAA
jgi:FixJ family two-component response regulator